MNEDRKSGLRKEVADADDTGLFASEEQIAEAETLLPLVQLHEALPREHPAHSMIDQLHAEVKRASPSHQTIEHHVTALRALPQLEAIVVDWWDDPRTQRFIANLGQIGL